jgi:hypothetical protein
MGFVVDKVALGQVFYEYFGFPCLHSTKLSILTISRGRYNRPEVADVPSGPSLDSTHLPHMRLLKTHKHVNVKGGRHSLLMQ